MYDGPQSPALAIMHMAIQQPLAALCIGLAVGTYVLVSPPVNSGANLPSEVEATKMYDGVSGQYLSLPDLARENLDPNTYDSAKGAPVERCWVSEDKSGQCICEEIRNIGK